LDVNERINKENGDSKNVFLQAIIRYSMTDQKHNENVREAFGIIGINIISTPSQHEQEKLYFPD
jgi:hypothetical protein